MPLLREGESIGAILLRRTEVRPFTDKQIALLQTFADQAVIAIGNVRLFEEVQAETRDLTESLQQQTATSEVLKVISRSPGDLQPVFERCCRNRGASFAARTTASSTCRRTTKFHAPRATGSRRVHANIVTAQSARSTGPRIDVIGRACSRASDDPHSATSLADPDTLRRRPQNSAARTIAWRSIAARRRVIGAIVSVAHEVKPFTEQQIELLETFADQAVIAIENVRLFEEVQARTRELSRIAGAADGDVGSAERHQPVGRRSGASVPEHARKRHAYLRRAVRPHESL